MSRLSSPVKLIQEEFPSAFEDKWRKLGNEDEGKVEHPVFGGRPTHCRSSMYTLVKILKPYRVLEIGSWTYNASNMMALAMDDFGIDGRVDSFDICMGGFDQKYVPPTNPRVKPYFWLPHHTTYDKWKYTSLNIVYPQFKLWNDSQIREKNIEILGAVCPEGSYDMILIDGDHSYEGVGFDWFYATKFAHKNTIFVIDDLYDIRHWQVRKFWDELRVEKYDFLDWNQKNPHLLVSMGVCHKDEAITRYQP